MIEEKITCDGCNCEFIIGKAERAKSYYEFKIQLLSANPGSVMVFESPQFQAERKMMMTGIRHLCSLECVILWLSDLKMRREEKNASIEKLKS